ncbi:MAG: THUMP domain-containing protein [Sulfolobales archaeon]|nr:THUMP domain-containing protein [Sulfolobales archaeon]MDW8082675.1 THUMP domain-containing protein [Sulfolobales archaeon]
MRYYLIKESPEIPLKSWRTRPKFEKALARAIEQTLASGGAEFRLSYSQGVFYLEVDRDVSESLTRVFGVYSICEVIPYRFTSLDDIADKAEEIFEKTVAGRKFAVRVRRHGEHRFTSVDVARAVGSRLSKYSAGVDLESPDVEIRIEVRGEYAYYVLKCWRGFGGLPVGTEGSALAMFSGGYDSTLAYLAALKRGARADFLHYYMGSTEATLAAVEVAKKLSKFAAPHEPVLIVVNFVPILLEIRERVSSRLRQIALRVLMHEVGQVIAEKHGYDALITGESVGQTSSQTLRNLRVVDYLVKPRVALLRPLSGMDKEEIISKIRGLGLYDYVVKVEEVCRISEGPVETRAQVEDVEKAIALVSRDTVNSVIANAKIYRATEVSSDSLLREIGADVEVDEVPEGWVLVDIRSRERYLSAHIPRAIHISELELNPQVPVVLYCDYGSASLLAAIEMRKTGVKAYSLRGGFTGYRRMSREIGCGSS